MGTDVVIGSGYGDEGKGKTVDYLCTNKTLNVKFTGSAQCGHTVVEPNGFRHVFNTIGAGTLRGAKTFLAKDFIFNTLLYDKELKTINKYSNYLNFKHQTLRAHKNCLVTTPIDMIINQAIERKRGNKKHGSCGLGINETIQRCEHNVFSTYFNDCDRLSMYELYRAIKNRYLPIRMKELGLEESDLPEDINYSHLLNDFQNKTYGYTTGNYVRDNSIIKHYPHVVFEGGQGLMLDKNNKHFPHVTNGNTGLDNVIAILKEIGYNDKLNIYYVTRPYKTRHGAGPLEHETDYFNFIEDKTNVRNEWQDNLRFGFLDLDILKEEVFKDISKLKNRKKHKYYLVINCLDQVEEIPYYKNNELYYSDREKFPKVIIDFLNTKYVKFNCLVGEGETRNDIREL